MINTKPAFNHLCLHPTSLSRAIQDVGLIVRTDPDGAVLTAINMVDHMVGVRLKREEFEQPGRAKPEEWALSFAQAVVEYCLTKVHNVDPDETIKYAWDRVTAFTKKPSNQWLFATEESTVQAGDMVVVTPTVNIPVAVTAEGKIKKGGKEKLAVALFQQFLDDKKARNEGPLSTDNQAFVAILIDQLQMTKAGATTYAYNMRKKFGIAGRPAK